MRMAGIGFRGAASVASLRDALARANPDGLKIDALVTEAAKARATVFRDFAQELGVPGLGITTEDLARMITPTQSARIEDRFGTGSLSEAAALAADPAVRPLRVTIAPPISLAPVNDCIFWAWIILPMRV
ncbi:hypothetical protein LCGC14_2673510 [marine sediment metagenome]|uniref:CobE/GbiG C-terminal domain-containing protein n=1 Tax=marine sediment metagenome TaxID=412755 RepID=A0A0F9CFF1_9ZZZZ